MQFKALKIKNEFNFVFFCNIILWLFIKKSIVIIIKENNTWNLPMFGSNMNNITIKMLYNLFLNITISAIYQTIKSEKTQ